MSVPGTWRRQGAYYRLSGTICTRCGQVAFPPRRACPTCQPAAAQAEECAAYILLPLPCEQEQERALVLRDSR
jgi:hypothetical protein